MPHQREYPRTWLDYYVIRSAEEIALRDPRFSPPTFQGGMAYLREMSARLRASIDHTRRDPARPDYIPLDYDHRLDHPAIERTTLELAIVEASIYDPFINTHPNARGMRLAPALLDALMGAAAHHQALMWDELLTHAWCLDLMESGIAIETAGAPIYPRAILINPITGIGKELCYWFPDQVRPVVLVTYDRNVPNHPKGEDFLFWWWGREYADERHRDLLVTLVQHQIEDLVSLAITYLTIARPEAQRRTPRIAEKKLTALRPVNQRHTLTQNTVFNIIDLYPPTDNFGRPREDMNDGEEKRRLSCRFKVRGHLRLARVGEGRRERKLVWVRGHERGPVDAPARTTVPLYDIHPPTV
jgi:hypothetical protein